MNCIPGAPRDQVRSGRENYLMAGLLPENEIL